MNEAFHFSVHRFGDISTHAQQEKDDKPVVLNRKIRVGTASYTYLSCVLHHGIFKDSAHFTCVAACPDGSVVEFDDSKVCIVFLGKALL